MSSVGSKAIRSTVRVYDDHISFWDAPTTGAPITAGAGIENDVAFANVLWARFREGQEEGLVSRSMFVVPQGASVLELRYMAKLAVGDSGEFRPKVSVLVMRSGQTWGSGWSGPYTCGDSQGFAGQVVQECVAVFSLGTDGLGLQANDRFSIEISRDPGLTAGDILVAPISIILR